MAQQVRSRKSWIRHFKPQWKVTGVMLALFFHFELPGYVKATMIPLTPAFGKNWKRGKVVSVLPDAKKVGIGYLLCGGLFQ